VRAPLLLSRYVSINSLPCSTFQILNKTPTASPKVCLCTFHGCTTIRNEECSNGWPLLTRHRIHSDATIANEEYSNGRPLLTRHRIHSDATIANEEYSNGRPLLTRHRIHSEASYGSAHGARCQCATRNLCGILKTWLSTRLSWDNR